MTASFPEIPSVVIDYVRDVFGNANHKASVAVSMHPSMHEETLDHILIMELSAAPSAFFAQEKMGVAIESHWLGGRWMYGRWEIADIAFFVLVRRHGHLVARKVALLQTKRLYSREISVTELDESDYRIGIGRLADRTDPIIPISSQRSYGFDLSSIYGAMRSGDEQIERISIYEKERNIPVYYGFYNPIYLPFQTLYPVADGSVPEDANDIGCRVIPASMVHPAISVLDTGKAPSINDLMLAAPVDINENSSVHGWRLESFIADEVLKCRQGRFFEERDDPNLGALLYRRSAPINAAITITIDIGTDD